MQTDSLGQTALAPFDAWTAFVIRGEDWSLLTGHFKVVRSVILQAP